ncbi:hypothetical protein ACFYO2_38590 [Streptomyces sp. NPDC006602]|uniref:hypothetical protein n=1 Tax=Streptomyces sp. NPDC006602 TaxID=3364751 RepID=UPI0036AC20FB
MEVPEEVADAPVAPVAPVDALAPPAQLAAQVTPRRRRRGRTALLIVGAAVLGLVAGTCGGYLVQADREPTKLPSLSQPTLPQAKGKGPEPLSAAQDRRVKTDGDLRKLLLKKPGGAKKADWLAGSDGWMDLAGYADMYEKPDEIFGDLVGDEFRRAAVTGWESGTTTLEIRLIQYRQEESPAAADAVENSQYWAEDKDATDSWTVPGTGSGMAYVHTDPETEAGYLPLYSAEAHAWRGDIAMEIWIYDTKPISKKKIMDLAERQMERL